MAKHAPTIMVSSTFYDLKQIRHDLAHFIEKDLGYNALLSEFDSFPIDPDADTIENCRRRVERDADILILIIGGRYGFVDKKSNKSVTNLEYLTARAKGIPIYAFIDRGILPLLPIWEKSPKAKFSDVVSDTKVFEFIKQVRSIDKVWTHEFDYAQTIVQTLKTQFAYQMKEGLQLLKQLATSQENIPTDISGKALRLILEKADFWEYYLFAQIITDEVEKYSDLREEHRLKLRYGIGETITRDNGIDWILERFEDLQRLISTLSDIVNEHLPVALGPPGSPGDSKLLVSTAKKVAEVYLHALNWSQRVRRIYTPSYLNPVFDKVIQLPEDLIQQLGNYGPRVTSELDAVRLAPKGAKMEVTITLTPRIVGADDIQHVMRECFLNSTDED